MRRIERAERLSGTNREHYYHFPVGRQSEVMVCMVEFTGLGRAISGELKDEYMRVASRFFMEKGAMIQRFTATDVLVGVWGAIDSEPLSAEVLLAMVRRLQRRVGQLNEKLERSGSGAQPIGCQIAVISAIAPPRVLIEGGRSLMKIQRALGANTIFSGEIAGRLRRLMPLEKVYQAKLKGVPNVLGVFRTPQCEEEITQELRAPQGLSTQLELEESTIPLFLRHLDKVRQGK